MGPGHNPAKCTINSNPVSHAECRPVRAPAQRSRREEQASPPRQKKRNKQTAQQGGNPRRTTSARLPEKKGGARDSHTTKRPRTPSTEGGLTVQPGNTKGGTHRAPRKNTGGPPSQTWRHPAESSGLPEERTARTRRHTPHRRDGGPPEKKHRCNPNERGRGDKEQEAQDRDRQRRAPESHERTGPRATTPRSPK